MNYSCDMSQDVHAASASASGTSLRNNSSDKMIYTASKALKDLLLLADKVAPLQTPVLIIGESGSGKELLSRYIHAKGNTASGPFVGVNCGSVPRDLMESEFFGYEEGSFTGAGHSKEGLFESAHSGTLFLDEIGEMPSALQVKLLRAIQEGEIRRLGGTRSRAVSVRIISATNRDLEDEVEKKLFREDLFYRIGVFVLKIPPLRERKEDIPYLAKYFCETFCKAQKRAVPEISQEAMNLLLKHHWPGNVRELENVIERALIFSGSVIQLEHLEFTGSQETNNQILCMKSLAEISQIAQQNAETSAILQALSMTGGNRVKAARILDVSYKTLLNKIRQYKLEVLP
jgi:two-component system, NtrC family, response regulator AtoC